MRRLLLIILSVLTTMCIMASHLCMQPARKPAAKTAHALNDSTKTDSATATTLPTTLNMLSASSDSVKAVATRTAPQPRIPVDTTAHSVTDSVKADTVKKPRPGIDSPVEYQAQDSMIYDAATGLALIHLQL